jgi:hypothetical protein
MKLEASMIAKAATTLICFASNQGAPDASQASETDQFPASGEIVTIIYLAVRRFNLRHATLAQRERRLLLQG